MVTRVVAAEPEERNYQGPDIYSRSIVQAVQPFKTGRAAELAGMYRVEFLLALERHKVFPFEAKLRDPKSGSLVSG